MVLKPESKIPELKMDPAALYREDIFTDRKVGAIRRLTPVEPDGASDPARRVVYIGETQLLTNVGTLPLSFEIEAQSLEEAVAKYADAVKRAFEQTLGQLETLRREAASSIVIPETGGFPSGGMTGGGKIKLP